MRAWFPKPGPVQRIFYVDAEGNLDLGKKLVIHNCYG